MAEPRFLRWLAVMAICCVLALQQRGWTVMPE